MGSRFRVLVVVALATACAGKPAAAVAAPPTIASESVTNVTERNAILNAEINPGGLLTKYKLQIDTTGHFKFDQNDSCALHPPGVFCLEVIIVGEPLPEGLIEPPESTLAAGDETQQVSVNLAGIGAWLEPGTTYHYRAIAANGPGVVEGPDQTFTTALAGGGLLPEPPSIDDESVSDITQTGATLEALINPKSTERGALYQFQIAVRPSEFLPEFACPTEGFPAGSSLCITLVSQEGALPLGWTDAVTEDQSVSVDLGDAGAVLEPGTSYYFRVIAARSVLALDTINWAEPIVYGSSQSFTTADTEEPEPPEGAPPRGSGAEPSLASKPPASHPSEPPVSHPRHHRRRHRGAPRCRRAHHKAGNRHRHRGRHHRRHRRGLRRACAVVRRP